MAVPKRRTSSTRRDKRRSHHALKPATMIVCSQCTQKKLPHRVCPHCGHYKGREVVTVQQV